MNCPKMHAAETLPRRGSVPRLNTLLCALCALSMDVSVIWVPMYAEDARLPAPSTGGREALTTGEIIRLLSEDGAGALDANMQRLASEVSVPRLAKILGNTENSDYARKSAASVLGRIGSREARDALARILDKTEAPLINQMSTLYTSLWLAIARCMDREKERELLEDLQHESPCVRYVAAGGPGRMKSEKAVSPLIRMLDDPHGDPRIGATGALGEIRTPEAVEILIAIVEKRRKGGYRVSAIEAMGKIGTDRAIQAIKTVSADDPAHWMAKKTLARIASREKEAGR